MTMIQDNDSLAALCEHASRFPYATIDTEFMRESTYWPKLCLVQIGTPKAAHAIDVLAEGIDLSPLLRLMADRSVLKVFHAARQDLEIFFHVSGHVPEPVFDTQIASMVCGYGDSIGYERLVQELTGQTLDKGMQYTDWAVRPLEPRQIAYALSDVTHLRSIYTKLSEELEETGRTSWLSEEMAVLTDPETYRPDPENAWKRIRFRHRKPRNLAILRELASWREVTAQKKNLPRSWILKDETLADIATRAPRSTHELASLRSVGREKRWRSHASAVLAAVDRARNLDPSHYPTPPEQPAQPGQRTNSELLRALLKLKCTRYRVAQKIVASASDLDRIAKDDAADVPALSGWRREVFGHDALRLKRGEIAITMQGNTLRLIEITAASEQDI